jgi:hypothetical protein
MRSFLRHLICPLLLVVAADLLASGCVSRSEAKLRERNAFLEGQNSLLMQQQAQTSAQNAQNAQIVQQAAQSTQSPQNAAPSSGIMVIGAVQNPQVQWVAGMTLAQAIASANYTGASQPKQIIITRNGETATMDANDLLNGKDVPVQAGDVIELR